MFAQQAGRERKDLVDLGGQWIGEGQARMRVLAGELGLEIFESYTDGSTVIRYDGHRYLDDNEIEAPSARDRAATEDLLKALSQAADLVVPDASQPWASPLAAAHDRLTIGQWIEANSDNEYARFYLGMYVTLAQAGGSLQEVSLLHSLFEWKANPADGEPEKYLIRGTAGQIPPLLSRQLGGDAVIQLSSKVVAIHQGSDGVTVGAITPQGYTAYEGKAVIVAIPPWLTGAISYTSSVPGQAGLPARRMHLTQRMAMGPIAKIVCIYDTPWWRTSRERLSGTSCSKGRLAGFTADTSPPGDEGPGVLTGFIQGDILFEWIELAPDDRKEWVNNDLVELFGEEARNPVDYVEALWPQEQFTGGAYNGYLPPGGWTSYGRTIREPFGRISWAGTETATQWYGYLDGAATAGERAAEEVLTKWL
jgi:monoamine oxidase